MEFYRKIQQLEQDFLESKKLLEQAKEAISHTSILTNCEIAINSIKQDLTEFVTQTNAQELETTKQTLKAQQAQELERLFSSNIAQIAEILSPKINLQALSKNISDDFIEQNAQIFKECIDASLEKRSYQEVIQSKIEQILSNLSDKLEAIDITHLTQAGINALLQKHKEEILQALDIPFLQNEILNDSTLKVRISLDVQNYARKIIEQNYLSAVKEVLKQKAKEVFEEVVALEELKEKRFLSGLNLAAISIEAELKAITKTLNAISDVTIAKNRLEALNNIGNPKPSYHKVLKEI